MKKVLTLCLVENVGRVLLGMKKRGFGAGHYNRLAERYKKTKQLNKML
jgi:hypothetical protein